MNEHIRCVQDPNPSLTSFVTIMCPIFIIFPSQALKIDHGTICETNVLIEPRSAFLIEADYKGSLEEIIVGFK